MDGGDMKKIWIIANWKSNMTIQEALDWISQVGPKIEKSENLEVVVCPTFSSLPEVKKEVLVGNFPLKVGVQDLSPFSQGAYTGEEAASLIKDLAEIAILGHSERRENFAETDEMVEEKVNKAIEAGIIPLVCVQSAETPIPQKCQFVAYEPIFAIGSGNPDTPANADKVAAMLKEKHNPDLEILYGGSVNSENAKVFVEQDNISGLLIGKASLDPQEFVKIVHSCLD